MKQRSRKPVYRSSASRIRPISIMSTPTRVTRSPASRESPRSRRGSRPAELRRARPRRRNFLHERRLQPVLLRPGDVGLDVVADHPGHLRVRVESLERGGEVLGARLSTTVASTSAAYSRPATKQPSRAAARARSATSGSCAGWSSAPAPAPRRRARGSCRRRRGSSPRSRPRPTSTASASSPTSWTSPRSSSTAGIVSARTRLRARDRPRSPVLELVVVQLEAHRPQPLDERPARLRGVVRDEAEPIVARRFFRTALVGALRIGSPDT